MTADTIRSYVRKNLFTDNELQLDEASYYKNGLYFIHLQGYPNSIPSPILTPFKPDTAALTSAAHTYPQA